MKRGVRKAALLPWPASASASTRSKRAPAAAIYTLVETAKLNGVDPRAWLADVLARLPDYPVKRTAELLPWDWKAAHEAAAT